jgi:hypothetical protein
MKAAWPPPRGKILSAGHVLNPLDPESSDRHWMRGSLGFAIDTGGMRELPDSRTRFRPPDRGGRSRASIAGRATRTALQAPGELRSLLSFCGSWKGDSMMSRGIGFSGTS